MQRVMGWGTCLRRAKGMMPSALPTSLTRVMSLRFLTHFLLLYHPGSERLSAPHTQKHPPDCTAGRILLYSEILFNYSAISTVTFFMR